MSGAVHEAADAMAAYARDVFWRTDSGFADSSRFSWESAAAWLHQYADGVTDETALHWFAPHDDCLSACGEGANVTTAAAKVTCGHCRLHLATQPPSDTPLELGDER